MKINFTDLQANQKYLFWYQQSMKTAEFQKLFLSFINPFSLREHAKEGLRGKEIPYCLWHSWRGGDGHAAALDHARGMEKGTVICQPAGKVPYSPSLKYIFVGSLNVACTERIISRTVLESFKKPLLPPFILWPISYPHSIVKFWIRNRRGPGPWSCS